jgi:prepilin peptidase CpaA
MNATQTIWAFTLAVAIVAAWSDWRTRRIPNWLTVAGVILGVGLHTVIAGRRGAAASLEGVGLALALLLPLVLLRALGAGDWKLMGALGAFLGPWMVLFVMLASFLISGFMAILMMIQAKRVKATLRNLVTLIRGFVSFGLRTNPQISLDNPGLLKLPFGVAAAIGTVVCLAATRWGL